VALPKLAITGSSGKIGTILMRGLADLFELYVIDIVATPGERTFRSDISEYDQIASVIKEIMPVPYIVHLAGDPRVDGEWSSILRNNIVGTKNLYEAARNHQVKKVVFASSNHVTGGYEETSPRLRKRVKAENITIRDPLRPDSDYATSKVFGESIARQYYELYGLESVCLRIGSVVAGDKPPNNERYRRIWLSHRDLLQLFKKSILSDVKFGIYYGVSNNKTSIWDISNAREDLGYNPEDDSSRF
jgi:nucleoside-diphosphate-sugar epimerase